MNVDACRLRKGGLCNAMIVRLQKSLFKIYLRYMTPHKTGWVFTLQ